MPIDSYELSSYAVSLASERNKLRPAATIHARAVPAAGDVQIYMRFYRCSEAELPKNSRVEGEGSRMYMVSFVFDQLAPAVDILRNEKPIFFSFNDKSATAYLATSDEPVGEGEFDASQMKKRLPPAKKA
jgi:hypothetical protein